MRESSQPLSRASPLLAAEWLLKSCPMILIKITWLFLTAVLSFSQCVSPFLPNWLLVGRSLASFVSGPGALLRAMAHTLQMAIPATAVIHR